MLRRAKGVHAYFKQMLLDLCPRGDAFSKPSEKLIGRIAGHFKPYPKAPAALAIFAAIRRVVFNAVLSVNVMLITKFNITLDVHHKNSLFAH